jgi:hypothetical protein
LMPITMLNKVPKDPRTIIKRSQLGVKLVEDLCFWYMFQDLQIGLIFSFFL